VRRNTKWKSSNLSNTFLINCFNINIYWKRVDPNWLSWDTDNIFIIFRHEAALKQLDSKIWNDGREVTKEPQPLKGDGNTWSKTAMGTEERNIRIGWHGNAWYFSFREFVLIVKR
jgi:hypothetical protein